MRHPFSEERSYYVAKMYENFVTVKRKVEKTWENGIPISLHYEFYPRTEFEELEYKENINLNYTDWSNLLYYSPGGLGFLATPPMAEVFENLKAGNLSYVENIYETHIKNFWSGFGWENRPTSSEIENFFKVSIEEVNVPYGTVECFRLPFGDHYRCFDLNAGIPVKAKASGRSRLGGGQIRQSIKLTDTNIPVSSVEKDGSLSLIWMSLGIGIGIILVIGAAVKKGDITRNKLLENLMLFS